jgi:hypothetical protein
VAPVSIVTCSAFLLSLLDKLPMPYGIPAANAYITPPDPLVMAKIPAIYVWPSDGQENRSAELSGTIPRNTGPGTPSGTKGIMHDFDIYVTWFSVLNGKQADPRFPSIVDVIMAKLRTSQPNPAGDTDPNTGLTSTIYNVGERMRYRTGVEDTADERQKRYDALISCPVWEIINA